MHEPGSRAWFDAYLAAFNADDFDTLTTFYHKDVQFHGLALNAVGCDALLTFYRLVRTRLRERLDCQAFIGSPTFCAAEIVTTTHAREDWPDFPTGPRLAGDRRSLVAFVFYDLIDGKIARMRSARFRDTTPIVD